MLPITGRHDTSKTDVSLFFETDRSKRAPVIAHLRSDMNLHARLQDGDISASVYTKLQVSDGCWGACEDRVIKCEVDKHKVVVQ